jgi:hypothetical protein
MSDNLRNIIDRQKGFSLFNPKFLEEIAKMKEKNLTVEILKKYKYPPEGYEEAIAMVIGQCEMWTDN